MVEILTANSYEESDGEIFNYLSVWFQDSDIYIWGCHEFTSLLTDKQGSLVKEIAIEISCRQAPNKDKGLLSARRKPMSERVKNYIDEDIENIANDRLKELINTIDLNIINHQMSNRMQIDGQASIEEEKCVTNPASSCLRKKEARHPLIGESENIDLSWSENQAHESLLRRRKSQRLNEAQVRQVMSLLKRFPGNRKLLQEMYKISRSTLRRIAMKMNVSRPFDVGSYTMFKTHKNISENAKQLIMHYLLPHWEPRSILMVKKYVESELQESYSIQIIRKFVRTEMKYVYKKGSSRPPVYAAKRTQLVKALFWTELLSYIARGEIVININESSFDRTVKREFSWLPMGRSYQIINERIKGRASLIMATWNTGEWFAMVVLDSVDKVKFWYFLKLLETILRRCSNSSQKSPIIIFDNAATHFSSD